MADADPTDAPSLLRNRNFILLWCAYGISAMGDHLSEMAILRMQGVADMNVDATSKAARLSFLFFLPFFVLAPVAGLLADRFSRRGLMITADTARCVILLFFATLVAWTTGWGGADWGPYVPMLLIGMFAALFSPARAALLPTIVGNNQLVRANGLIAGLGIIGTMAASLIGGHLAEHYHPTVAFRINAGTFMVSAVFLAAMIPPERKRGRESFFPDNPPSPQDRQERLPTPFPRRSGLREIMHGFRYAACHRRVKELLLIASLVWFCGPLVNSVIPAVVRDVYQGGIVEMSAYRAFLGLGFIIGAIVISVLGDSLRSEIAITWSLFGVGLSIAVFAASTFLPFSPRALSNIGAVGVVGAGVFGMAIMASFNSLLQRIVPNRYRGRIFGVKDVCAVGALLIATGALGVPRWTNVDVWVGYILLAVAIVTFTAGAITLRIRLGRSSLEGNVAFSVNLNEFVTKFWYRLQCIGRPTLPHSGACIVTANHVSPPDPLLIYGVAPYRRIAFMVAEEYTRLPVARYFINLVQCIPVRRDGTDTAATKKAIRFLRDGQAVGIFIEGRMIPPGESGEPQDGVAMLALKTGAPVIPAFISGTTYHENVVRGLFARHRARVRFGPAVNLDEFRTGKPDRATIRAASARIYEAIKSLAPPSDTADEAPHQTEQSG